MRHRRLQGVDLEEVTIAAVEFKHLLELTTNSDTGSSQSEYLLQAWEHKHRNAVRLLHEDQEVDCSGMRDVLEEVGIMQDTSVVDCKHLLELTKYSEKGSCQLESLVKAWEHKQNNDVRLLREELDKLRSGRQEMDQVDDKNTIGYWKQRAEQLETLLEASVKENIKNLERQPAPVQELSRVLNREDNFLHFVLQNAPVVIGHQDKELRYRFIYNHFTSLGDEDIIGKTDVEVFSGAGVKESQDFKKEVMQRGLPAKREITFDTGLFGSKTFLLYVEPVFSKAGETIGVNYMGMDMTDQVIKREKMATLREQIALQKAKEIELNKAVPLTVETVQGKQQLEVMLHGLRSPLTGVVSMAEILANSNLDQEQRQLADVFISSGGLVLQLIEDILDFSKLESGAMKLEATKFRPRDVIKHVLQTAAASLQKELKVEGYVAEGVPLEVVGDALRVQKILTNLISNAVKFTLEGRIGINLYVVPEPEQGYLQNGRFGEGPITPVKVLDSIEGDVEKQSHVPETTVWIHCDVYDTGMGIPENAISTLFKTHMEVTADHDRKDGETGFGLAICKQQVELMGGRLTVTSREHCGSTFSFSLPFKVSLEGGPPVLSDMEDNEVVSDANGDDTGACFFTFRP